MAIIVVSAGTACAPGGITQQSLVLVADGRDFTLGEPAGQDETERKFAYLQHGVWLDYRGDSLASISVREKGPELKCGIGVQDSVEDVLRVFGKNVAYAQAKSENRYMLVYFYYEKDGSLVGTSDKIDYNNMRTLRFTEQEREYLEQIKDEMFSGDNYLVELFIEEGFVARIELHYQKRYMKK